MLQIKRISSSEELQEAFKIRQKVFVEEQCVDPELEYDEFEDTAIHYLAMLDNRPVGTSRWRETENGVKLERFAVLKEARSMKVGKFLLIQCLQDVPQNKKIYLHAQVHVIPFYEKCRFKAIGEEFIEADIRHRKMIYTP